MSGLGANVLTIVDWAKRLDPDGKVPVIAELLAQRNEILMDMQWSEGNLPTGHRITMRTGLPTAAWRLLNQGVQPTKSTTAQVDEACAILEAWSEVDEDLVKLNGNDSAFRLSEAQAFIEAMNQTFSSAFFYGNSSVTPEQFTGLAVRYSSLSATNGQNIITGGGSGGDNASIWLIGWGEQTFHGIFPKGSKAGLIHDDFGVETVETSATMGGTRLRAFRERFQWKPGVALKDWRYVVRGANIDISNLVAKSSAADLPEMMIRMYKRLPHPKLCKPVYYMNRTVEQMLDIQLRDDVQTGGQLKYEVVDGVQEISFRGVPIRIVDQLTLAEATVS